MKSEVRQVASTCLLNKLEGTFVASTNPSFQARFCTRHQQPQNLPPKMEAVRSVLQPVTKNLPTPIFDLGVNLLGSHCYKTLVLDIDPFTHPDCLKLAISKGLGIGIVGASAVVKLPQLLKLLNSQSAEGISFLSYLLETSAFLIGLAYNVRQGFPFSTYGETALIAVQNVAIATLVLHFGGKTAGAAVFVAGLAAAAYAMFNPQLVDAKMMTMLQTAAGVLGVSSKLPQVYQIWKEGGTGQLSAFAVSMPYSAFALKLLTSNVAGLQLPCRLLGPHLHHRSRG